MKRCHFPLPHLMQQKSPLPGPSETCAPLSEPAFCLPQLGLLRCPLCSEVVLWLPVDSGRSCLEICPLLLWCSGTFFCSYSSVRQQSTMAQLKITLTMDRFSAETHIRCPGHPFQPGCWDSWVLRPDKALCQPQKVTIA